MVDNNRSHIKSNNKTRGAGQFLGHRPAPARKCVLNEEGCLDLSSILDSFNGPINEEQAWALCYQTAQCMRSLNENSQRYVISDAHQLLIQKEGSVHPKTVIASSPSDEKRRPATSEFKLISSLGVVLFQALDYGFSEDEERALDPSLEVLIERLTSADCGQNGKAPEKDGDQSSDEEEYDRDSKDEGIERDSDILNEDEADHSHQKGLTVGKVIEMCVSHLSHPDQAESHYRAVCRALVAEALELSTFLEKISLGTKELRKSSLAALGDNHSNRDVVANLDDLEVADWARLWMQVIRQLRHGVSLKKIDYSQGQHPIEYELTPYEMLLDDIRMKKYKLKHVLDNGVLPARVKKDAHALILEFIRSRPPLVPVSKRTLAPPPLKQPTIYEKLMHSIRQQHKLKPTPPSSAKQSPIHLGRITDVETSRTKLREDDVTPAPRRRLIKADLTLRLSNSFEDEEDEFGLKSPPNRRGSADEAFLDFQDDRNESRQKNEEEQEEEEGGDGSKAATGASIRTESSSTIASNASTTKRKFSLRNLTRLLSFDKQERRHSITVCESPAGKRRGTALEEGAEEQKEEGREGRRESNNNSNAKCEELIVDPNEDTRDRVANIWAATAWGKTYDCLSLTLEEVQHIRSVLTKAEMESLGVTKSLREDLEKGRICFTCLKTRFSFFGPWPVRCKLCERSICERCSTKMHIPTEQFAKIPIYMLSPTPTPSPPGEGENLHYFPNFPINMLGEEGTNRQSEEPSAPKGRKSKLMRALTMGRADFLNDDKKKPVDGHVKDSGILIGAENKKTGPLMKLCRDCKLLVRHIIDVGYTNFDSSEAQRKPKTTPKRPTTLSTTSPLPLPLPRSLLPTQAGSCSSQHNDHSHPQEEPNLFEPQIAFTETRFTKFE